MFALMVIIGTHTLVSAQTTVTIDLSNSQIGMGRSGDPNGPAPAQPEFASYSWTCQGVHCIGKTLMSIDLSQIPANVTILSASLSLFADPECTYLGWYGQPTVGTFNAGVIKRVTGAWDEATVTWNNHPGATNVNRVVLPTSSTVVQDYPNLDITGIIQDLYNDAANNFGIVLRMRDEVNYYKSLIFGSPLNANPDIRPVLTVTYDDGQKLSTPAPNAFEFGAEVSPNPASDFVMLDFSNVHSLDQITLQIFDLNGKEVMTINNITGDQYTFDVSGLQSGIYFFRAENKTTQSFYEGKIVKQ